MVVGVIIETIRKTSQTLQKRWKGKRVFFLCRTQDQYKGRIEKNKLELGLAVYWVWTMREQQLSRRTATKEMAVVSHTWQRKIYCAHLENGNGKSWSKHLRPYQIDFFFIVAAIRRICCGGGWLTLRNCVALLLQVPLYLDWRRTPNMDFRYAIREIRIGTSRLLYSNNHCMDYTRRPKKADPWLSTIGRLACLGLHELQCLSIHVFPWMVYAVPWLSDVGTGKPLRCDSSQAIFLFL